MIIVRLNYQSNRTFYAQLNPDTNCGSNSVGTSYEGNWSAETLGLAKELTCVVTNDDVNAGGDYDVTITNTGVKYYSSRYNAGGFFISNYTFHIRNYVCENPLPIIFSDTSSTPLSAFAVINACVSIPESCTDLRSSEYPQDLLVTFNVDKAQGWNDTQFSLQKTLQIDSSGSGEVRFNFQSEGYIDNVNPRGFLGLTARFVNDNVRSSGSVTVWGRIIQKYSAVIAGVLIPVQKQGNEQILGVVSFSDECSNFADSVSISDSLDLSGLDFDIVDAAVNTSYDIVLTRFTWTGFEELENFCCDDSTGEPLPEQKEPISLPLPHTGTVPIPPDDGDPTGETHYGEGGRIGESINIECICNNLIYLTNEVRELQKLKTDLSGLTSVLDGIHQDLANIRGELDGSLYAHIEGEKLGLASILYGRFGESSGGSDNLQDLVDKIESIFTNQQEGANRKTQYDVLADLKDSLDSKDLQVDVYADEKTSVQYSFGDSFNPEKF